MTPAANDAENSHGCETVPASQPCSGPEMELALYGQKDRVFLGRSRRALQLGIFVTARKLPVLRQVMGVGRADLAARPVAAGILKIVEVGIAHAQRDTRNRGQVM